MQLIFTLRFLESIIVLVPLTFLYRFIQIQLTEIILIVIHFNNAVS